MGFVRAAVGSAGIAVLCLGLHIAGPAGQLSPAGAATRLSIGSLEDPRSSKIDRATWRQYLTAISDSAIAIPAEVVSNLLVPVSSDARTKWRTIDGVDHILVTTLRYAPVSTVASGGQFTLDESTWVSIPGQLDEECVRYSCDNLKTSRLDLQLKQIIGLPPDADYRFVSQFWVKPSDLFRPCTDPRITSPSCPEQALGAAAGIPATVGKVNLADFLWTQANYAWRAPDRFRPQTAVSCAQDYANSTVGQCYGYPWTRLGYTYDWTPGAKDDVGVTEFVVVEGAVAYLEKVGTQREFFPFAKGDRTR
jgi:hypothetical protein